MEILILAILLGLIPATIAHNKGYSFLGWWILGSLLFIVALPIMLVAQPLPGSNKAIEQDAMKRAAAAPTTALTGPPSVMDEIRKAKRLLDEGAITEDEFDRIKRRLV